MSDKLVAENAVVPETSQRLRQAMTLSYVKRWSTVGMLREQNVAEHSYRVTVITLLLYKEIVRILRKEGVEAPVLSDQAILWALFHDVPECASGDIDCRFKDKLIKTNNAGTSVNAVKELESIMFPWAYKLHDQLTKWESALIKIADLIETMTWASIWGSNQAVTQDGLSIKVIVESKIEDLKEWSNLLSRELGFDTLPIVVEAIRAISPIPKPETGMEALYDIKA